MYPEKEQQEKKTPIFEPLKRKNPFPPITSEEHFFSELSTYSPDLRTDLLLAEVRLKKQTDGEISAFWNIWTNWDQLECVEMQ